MAKNIDNCPICNEYIDIGCSGFQRVEFITGKKYECICLTCASIPKNSFVGLMPKEIKKTKELFNTIEEMIEDGFNKKRAEISLKAIKKIMKKK